MAFKKKPAVLTEEIFNAIVEDYARARKTGPEGSYNYDAGTCTGIEAVLYHLFGCDINWDNKDENGNYVEVSVAKNVKEASAKLIEEWSAVDAELNGEYEDQFGNRFDVETPYTRDNRCLRWLTSDGTGRTHKRQYVDNDTFRTVVRAGIWRKHKTPIEVIESINLKEATDEQLHEFNEALDAI